MDFMYQLKKNIIGIIFFSALILPVASLAAQVHEQAENQSKTP